LGSEADPLAWAKAAPASCEALPMVAIPHEGATASTSAVAHVTEAAGTTRTRPRALTSWAARRPDRHVLVLDRALFVHTLLFVVVHFVSPMFFDLATCFPGTSAKANGGKAGGMPATRPAIFLWLS
jgi:hypothetical protein